MKISMTMNNPDLGKALRNRYLEPTTMKHSNLSQTLRLCVCLCGTALAISPTPAAAAAITWTNTAGGDWNTAANWKPNQVPGSSDTVFITNNGTFTVTAASGLSVASLTLGGTGGKQTVNWSSGTLSGNLTIASNGVLTMSGSGDRYLSGTITNQGTVAVVGSGYLDFNGAGFYNQPGGLLDLQSDLPFYWYTGSPLILKRGTVRKNARSARITPGGA